MAINQEKKRRILVTITHEDHERIRREAEKENRSVSNFVNNALKTFLEACDKNRMEDGLEEFLATGEKNLSNKRKKKKKKNGKK